MSTGPSGTVPDGTVPDGTAPDGTVPHETALHESAPHGNAPDPPAQHGTEAQAAPPQHAVAVEVNGTRHERRVEPRLLLSDFLRHELGLTGTHVGCEHGVCGACTVLLDGEPARSCLLLAVQADGRRVRTVEGLAPAGAGGPGPQAPPLHPLQEAFRQTHGLQCGFCTPGFLMTLVAFLAENPDPSEQEIRHAISGNLCRCTGYQNIVAAARRAAEMLRQAPGQDSPPAQPSAEPSAETPEA